MPATYRHIPLGALLALTLGGCASQNAITEHTDPLRARLAQVEQTTTANAGALSSREAALTAQLNGMAAEIKAMREALANLAGGHKVLTERSAQAELRLDELASLNRDASDAIDTLDEAQAKTELRLDEVATQARDAEDQIGTLAERMTQADLRLDEAMTLARDASAAAPASAEAAK